MKQYLLPAFAFLGLILGLLLPAFSERIWLATLVIGGIPIVWQTFKGLLKGQFASDIVAMLAIITAIFMEQAFAGAVVVLMQSGGEALEAYGLRKASSSLAALLARAPRFALRKRGQTIERIHAAEVQIGDILVVRPGDLIPVDGAIVRGAAEIDESALTGEPLARTKTEGDAVLSGSVDVNGSFEMRAAKISQESQYQKIVTLVEKAQHEKAPIQRLADRYAIFLTPIALIMSLLGYLFTDDSTTLLAVLVVATPCPLILATPLAILCGINKSARSGIIVKGGAPMEQVGKCRAAVFDKTGTITFGTPFVEEVIPLNHETADNLLYKTACIEQLSSHSIAKAIVDKAGRTLVLPSHFRESPGRGVEGEIDGERFTIGSHLFLEQTLGHTCFANCEKVSSDKLLCFVAKNGLCVGVLVISDRIRTEAAALMDQLRALGVREIVMLTGDSEKNALAVAKQAGIQIVRAALLPAEKVDVLKQLKTNYDPIVMIGDGINDAPSLATATVGIAMGAYGSAISAEAADIVLLVDDLSKVKEVVAISQQTLHIAKESIFIGMGLSFALMVIAALGFIQPAVGALLQEVIDVVVILNALRVR